MEREIISSIGQINAMLPNGQGLERDTARLEAIKHYLSKGGVLHLCRSETGWPKLLYPTKTHLRKKIEDLRGLREKYDSRLGSWGRKYSDAKNYTLLHNIKKLKEPLYWKHLAKCGMDADYRTDSDKVKLPVHLVADGRWKPMIKMFLSNMDYRKQLVQTVDESIVYRDNKKLARYADFLQGFRMEQSGKKMDELKKKLSEVETDISAMLEISRWASF